MAWVTTDGNSGAYRIGGSGLAALPRTAKPLSMLIDHAVFTSRSGQAGTGGAHVEWKIPVAVANQTGTYGAFIGPMQQDVLTWEGFIFKNDSSLDFCVPMTGASTGLSFKAGMWIRAVMSAGNHGSNGGGTTAAIGRLGHHLNLPRGNRKTGTNQIDALDRLAIGYPGNLYVRNNANGINDTPPVNGMLDTPQPMLQHTIFARAAFYDVELPDSILEELARGRHPLDFPSPWRPKEFYPMNNPAETAPRCQLTGNTMTVTGSTFQYLTQSYITTNSLSVKSIEPPAYYVPAWKKNWAPIASAINPVLGGRGPLTGGERNFLVRAG